MKKEGKMYFKELDLVFEYNYYPGTPAKMYLKNGDPGYPAESAEVEIDKVTADVKVPAHKTLKNFMLRTIMPIILFRRPKIVKVGVDITDIFLKLMGYGSEGEALYEKIIDKIIEEEEMGGQEG